MEHGLSDTLVQKVETPHIQIISEVLVLRAALENYLKVDNVPQSWRKLYCNIRISCHDLEIERGRYCRPRKPPEERICQVCKLESETEQHFILACPAYTQHRKVLFKEIRVKNPIIQNMSHAERFRYLLSSKDTFVIEKVMQFIFNAHKKRQDILGEITCKSHTTSSSLSTK